MTKNTIILRGIGALALLVGLALLAWALATPLLKHRETERLIAEARQALSPPTKGVTNLDDVDCDHARQLLERAVDLTPSNGLARRELPLAQGCAALLRGDLVLAESSLRAAASQMTSDTRVHRWLGALAIAQNQPGDAEVHFRRGLVLDDEDLPCRVGLSDALAEIGRPEDALAILEGGEAPALALLEIRRGMLYEDLDRLDDARRAYRLAMELSDHMAEPRNNLAALEGDAGRLELAWQLQLEAVERAPDDALILLNTGLLAITRGHDGEALRYLRRATELEQSSADPARALADQLLVGGRVEDAIAVLGPAVDRYPRDAALRNTLGNALAAVGRADEARAAYQLAIERNGNLAEPHNGLAALMLAEDDLTGAEEQLRQALHLAPANLQVRRNQSVLSRRRSELERAESERLLARGPQTR